MTLERDGAPVLIDDAATDPKAQSRSSLALGGEEWLKEMRPDIVWFGEAVDMREGYLLDLADKTEIFIGVGTSAQVYPAAGMLSLFGAAREKYFIDPHPPASIRGYRILAGPAGEHLPPLVEELLARA